MFDLNSYNCPAQILFPHLKDKSSRNCILHELWSNLYQMHLEAERNDHALSPIWNYVNKMCLLILLNHLQMTLRCLIR